MSDEYPSALDDLLASAHALSENGDQEPLSPDLHSWLRRALQLDVRHSFKSPAEAHTGLEELLANDDTYSADTNALTAFLERYHGSSQTSTTQEPIVRPIQPTPQASAPSVVHEVPSEPPPVELLPALFQEPKPPVEIQPAVTAPEIADSKAESETAPREVAVDREVSFGPRRTITATEEPEPVTQSKRFVGQPLMDRRRGGSIRRGGRAARRVAIPHVLSHGGLDWDAGCRYEPAGRPGHR